MSEPDAVPLPREGEVFFDVRGEARSMRLSWYADSRVAVFSIWQANRCTGTFRLPFADLARMVHTLQSGPRPHQEPQATAAYAASPVYNGYPQDVAYSQDYGRDAAYQQAPHEPAHPLADYDPPNYQDTTAYQDEPAYQDAGYGPGAADPGGYHRAGYDRTGYDRTAYDRAAYDRTGYERTGEYRAPHPQDRADYGYERDGYGAAGPTHLRPERGQWPGESGHGFGGPGATMADHDLPNFPSVPARTGQSAADWALP